jgi:hypothetical protein
VTNFRETKALSLPSHFHGFYGFSAPSTEVVNLLNTDALFSVTEIAWQLFNSFLGKGLLAQHKAPSDAREQTPSNAYGNMDEPSLMSAFFPLFLRFLSEML